MRCLTVSATWPSVILLARPLSSYRAIRGEQMAQHHDSFARNVEDADASAAIWFYVAGVITMETMRQRIMSRYRLTGVDCRHAWTSKRKFRMKKLTVSILALLPLGCGGGNNNP